MVLCALEGYRQGSFRLAEPRYRPLLHRIIRLFSEHRAGISRWLDPTPATMEMTASWAEALGEPNPFCPSTDQPRSHPSDSMLDSNSKRERLP